MNDNLRHSFSPEDLGLVDSAHDESFDRLSALAAAVFDVPVSLVSIVQFEQDRQYFKSSVGLGEEWARRRETPLSH